MRKKEKYDEKSDGRNRWTVGQRRVTGQLHQRKEEKRLWDEERNCWKRDREGVRAPAWSLEKDRRARDRTSVREMETRGRPNKDKKGKKRGVKGDEWRSVSLSSAWRRWREPATTWLSFLFLCSLSTSVFFLWTFLSLLVPPHSFLGPRDTRSFLCLSVAVKSTSRSHTAFRPLRLAKPPTPPSPDATPQSRTAVAACRCTFLVDAFSWCTRSSAERRPTSLYLKTCDATEPRENGLIVLCVPTFSWRLRFSFSFSLF